MCFILLLCVELMWLIGIIAKVKLALVCKVEM